MTLTYLTPGLGWSADYVALFDEAAGKMDVQGWITLTNSSGTPYVNADTLLVARDWGEGTMTKSGYPFVVKELKRGQSLAQARSLSRQRRGRARRSVRASRQ